MKKHKVAPPKGARYPYDLSEFEGLFQTATGTTDGVKQWLIDSCRNPKVGMLERLVFPHLYVPQDHYLYAPIQLRTPGHSGYSPQVTFETLAGKSPLAAVANVTLITNPLGWTSLSNPSPPKDRARNVGICVYTLEFDTKDHPGVDLLDRARGWHKSGRLGRLFKKLSRYRDFIGFALVYSGRSSPQLHLLFDLRHLRSDLASAGNSSYKKHFIVEVPDDRLYGNYSYHWDLLAHVFSQEVDGSVTPDRQLRTWVQPRRSPHGLRRVLPGDQHPLGFAPGTLVPQVVLVENLRSAARGATKWFHDPIAMLSDVPQAHVGRGGKNAPVITRGSLDVWIARICRRLIGAEYPEYSHHETANGVNRFKFFNSPTDRSPDSFMVGEKDRIELVGKHNLAAAPVLKVSADRIVEIAQILATRHLGDNHEYEQRWRTEIQDKADIRPWLNRNLPEIALSANRVWIRSIEGAGKTTSLLSPTAMELLHEQIAIDRASAAVDHIVGEDVTPPAPFASVMVAFASYAQAEEKLAEFNAKCQTEGSRFHGYLLKSIGRLYRECLDGADPITDEQAFSAGDSSIWRLVHKRQPKVFARMMAVRGELHAIIASGGTPVLFTVQDVAMRYEQGHTTRFFYAPSFSADYFCEMDSDSRSQIREQLRQETEIGMVIVDEVSTTALIDMDDALLVDLVADAEAVIDRQNPRSRSDKFEKFQSWRRQKEIDGGVIDFFEFERVADINYEKPDRLKVDATAEVLFDRTDGTYAGMTGGEVFVKAKDWWSGFPRAVFLTTEILPTVIAKKVIKDVVIFDLDTDAVQDDVRLWLDQDCHKRQLSVLETKIRNSVPDVLVISNMMEGAITHTSARGLNSYSNRDIASLYTSPAPKQYLRWAAINQKFGMTDAIRLAYVDQFNQTVGRNRGMRNAGGDHLVVFSPRLYHWLAGFLAAYGRYRLVRTNLIAAMIDEEALATA